MFNFDCCTNFCNPDKKCGSLTVPGGTSADTCAMAGPLTFTNGTARVYGTTAQSLNDYTPTACSLSGKDVVYTFTNPTAAAFKARVERGTTTFLPGLYLRKGTCGSGPELSCATSNSVGGSATIEHAALAPGTYYLFVDGVSSADTGGSFLVTATLTPVAGPVEIKNAPICSFYHAFRPDAADLGSWFAVRMVPPFTPWTATKVKYFVSGVTADCDGTLAHRALVFKATGTTPPTTPVVHQAFNVPTGTGTTAKGIEHTLTTPLQLGTGESLFLMIEMAGSGAKGLCPLMCEDSPVVQDRQFWSTAKATPYSWTPNPTVLIGNGMQWSSMFGN